MFSRKIQLLIIAISASAVSLSALQEPIFKQQKDVILWDIHDVILTRDGQKTMKAIWEFNNKKALLNNISGQLFKGSFYFLWKYITSNETGLAELITLAERENNHYLTELILNIANAYKPILGTWKIIKELYKLGYTQHIGSNISLQAFNELINPAKNPQLAPIFSYFDLTHPQVIAVRDSEPKIINKPSRVFFEEYLTNNNINIKTTRVIFIDDNKSNIIAAARMGFVAILFTSPKQLRADLRSLGISIAPNSESSFGIAQRCS